MNADMSASILIFDRDRLTRRGLSLQLTQRGCRVHEAESLEQANKIAHSTDIDLALLALRSLKSEALLAIKNIKIYAPETPVILLTEPEDIALSIQGLKSGASDDLMEPVDVEELLSKIRIILDSRRKKLKKSKES